jgi:UDP-N-acetylmuramate--alanine ligase
MKIDLNEIKSIYVIGIKGSGVIALVQILHSMGIKISGSDTDEKFFSDEILDNLGINYKEKFDSANIPKDVDFIVYSTAYNGNNNIEFKTAQEKGMPMISYPEMLAYLFNERYGIAVCGTHGKTTTAALLANNFKEAGLDPQAAIGSRVINWDGNALIGKGEYFIAEADEYQNKLSLYEPKAVILTSCDFDHPDYFKTSEEYKDVFKKFVKKIPNAGFLIIWGDSVDTSQIAQSARCNVLTYGFGEDNDYQAINITNNYDAAGLLKNKLQKFEIVYRGESLGNFEIHLYGKHNILNTMASVAVCHKLGLDLEKVKQAVSNFKGTTRRFEYIGERNGAILIDDYGHHPEELKATLSAAREMYPNKNIWAVFHPHTFTRTKALLSEFSQSFDEADKVVVLDIYGSAREIQGGVHSNDLVALINKYTLGKAEYIATIEEVIGYLKDRIGPEDIVVAIGAGNVWEAVRQLKEN